MRSEDVYVGSGSVCVYVCVSMQNQKNVLCMRENSDAHMKRASRRMRPPRCIYIYESCRITYL